jgi:hypothetical protein
MSGGKFIIFVILLAVGDEDVVIISFNYAGHLRFISLCKLNLVLTKVKFLSSRREVI